MTLCMASSALYTKVDPMVGIGLLFLSDGSLMVATSCSLLFQI